MMHVYVYECLIVYEYVCMYVCFSRVLSTGLLQSKGLQQYRKAFER